MPKNCQREMKQPTNERAEAGVESTELSVLLILLVLLL